jgi:hypothetical protein
MWLVKWWAKQRNSKVVSFFMPSPGIPLNVNLRQYLIGQALAGLMANPTWNPKHQSPDFTEHFEPLVNAAVIAADGVLKRLKAGPGGDKAKKA